jgi:hypothetical protein
MEHPRPGWYRDRRQPHLARYWDGSTWTGETRAIPPTYDGEAASVAEQPSQPEPSQPQQTSTSLGADSMRKRRWLDLYDFPLWKDWLAWVTGFAIFAACSVTAREYFADFRSEGLSAESLAALSIDLALPIVFQCLLFGVLPGSVRMLFRKRRRRLRGRAGLADNQSTRSRLRFMAFVVVLPAALAVGVAASETGETEAATPTPELCSTLQDVLNSLAAFSSDVTQDRALVVDDDLRRLSMEATRSGDTAVSNAAGAARTAWAANRAASRRKDEEAVRTKWVEMGTNLKLLHSLCGLSNTTSSGTR